MLLQAGDDVALGRITSTLGYTALVMRDYAGAEKYSREALELVSRIGDVTGILLALANLGCGLLLAGRNAERKPRSSSA